MTNEETRRCGTCGEARPLAMFYVGIERRKAENGKPNRMWCRICHRAYLTKYRQPKVEYADRIKLERGCADCGIKSVHPEIYDFDHLPGAEKVKSVAALITSGSWDALRAEIAKCEVVCSNCHRIRTRARDHSGFGKDRVA